MSGSLLDSNIIIDFFRNKLRIVEEILSTEDVYVPVTAIGGLYYGAMLSGNKEYNHNVINNFISKINVLSINIETAQKYANIKAKLKQNGTSIPENDIWIAFLSIQHDFELVTNDKHFNKIDELKIKNIQV